MFISNYARVCSKHMSNNILESVKLVPTRDTYGCWRELQNCWKGSWQPLLRKLEGMLLQQSRTSNQVRNVWTLVEQCDVTKATNGNSAIAGPCAENVVLAVCVIVVVVALKTREDKVLVLHYQWLWYTATRMWFLKQRTAALHCNKEITKEN